MTANDPAPRGLHRRMAALERRIARIEAAMTALRGAYAAAARGPDGAAATKAAAARLAAAQADYDDALRSLRGLQRWARRLRYWGLAPADTASWRAVCRALGLHPGGDAHRAVRRQTPALHVLLHRCALPARCALDGAAYVD